jgi:hypothetical protein
VGRCGFPFTTRRRVDPGGIGACQIRGGGGSIPAALSYLVDRLSGARSSWLTSTKLDARILHSPPDTGE